MHFHFIAKRNAVGQQLRQGGVGRGCPGGVGAEKVDLSLQNRRRLPGGRPWPRSLPTSQPLCPSMSAHGKWHQAPTGHRVNGITIAIVISVTISTDHRCMASNSHRSQGERHQAPTGHRVNGMTVTIVISIASAIGIIITICSTIATGQGLMASSSHRSRVNGCKL